MHKANTFLYDIYSEAKMHKIREELRTERDIDRDTESEREGGGHLLFNTNFPMPHQ